MENLSQILDSLGPILGVVVGATLTWFFSRWSDSRKRLKELKIEAYRDYLKGVAEMGSNSPDSKIRFVDAKTRIAIFGDDSVVEALAEFERARARKMDTPEARVSFLKLATLMRADATGIGLSNAEHIEAILMGAGKA